MSNKNLFKSLWLLMLFLVVGTVSAQKVARIGSTEYATFANAMSAVQDGDIIYLLADADASDVAFTPCNNKTVIIAGKTGNEVLNMGTGHKGGIQNSNITFLNLKMQIRHSTVSGTWYTEGMYHATKIKYENVVIDGAICTYDDVDFLNCTFTNNPQNAEYTTWNYGGTQIFKGCTFETASAGTKSFIKLYNQGMAASVAVVDCEFKDPSPLPSGWKGCDIYNSNPTGLTQNAKIYTANNTTNGTLLGHSSGSDAKLTVCNSAEEMGIILPSPTVLPPPVAKFGDNEYTSFEDAIKAALVANNGIAVELLSDVTYAEGAAWTPIVFNGGTVVIDGKNFTVTGLPGMLFNKQGSGSHHLRMSNITFDDAKVNGTTGNEAVIVGYADVMNELYFENVTIKNSTVTGSNYAAAFVGYAAGWNKLNDGPVFQQVTFKNCTVENCTITGGGSTGALMGHAAGNAWGKITVDGTTVKDNEITCTGSSTNKAGALFGTVGAAGLGTGPDGADAGLFVSATVSGNTVKSGSATITTICGRQGSTGGTLVLTEGGSYDSAPFNTTDTWASCAEGFELKENNGTWGVTEAIVAVTKSDTIVVEGVAETTPPAEQNAVSVAIKELTKNDNVISEEATNVAEVEEVTTLKIEVKNVAVETKTEASVAVATVKKVTFDVQPMKDEVKVTETEQPLTFRLPVPQSFTNEIVKVSHDHNGNVETFSAFVQGTGAAKYVELASTKFSDWTIEDIATLESLEITTANDLVKLSTYVNAGNSLSGKTVKLANDIDMTGVAFSPIGTDSHKFMGTFDGQNHIISNLTITASSNDAGLFGKVFGATIKDVKLSNAYVTNTAENYTGLLVGAGYANIDNCEITGGSVIGVDQVGAVIGYLSCGYVKNCTVDGVTVTADGDRAGGITGNANIDSNYDIIGNTVKNSTIIAAKKVGEMRSAAALVGQVMASASNHWVISDNDIISVTTKTADDETFVPVSEFRPDQFQADALTGGHIVRNHWEPATDPDTYVMYDPSNSSQFVTIENFYPVAKIETTKYASLADAFAAVPTNGTATEIKVLKNCEGNGIIVNAGQSVSVDFGGHTYTVNTDVLAGSNGTKNQAFQLLKNATVEFKNGAIVGDNANIKMLIQNYSNLTLDNMTLDATQGTNSVTYVLSTNNGSTTINNTVITAKEDGIAFDVCAGWGGYTSNAVEVKGESVINGKIEVSKDSKNEATENLTLTAGDFTAATIVVAAGGDQVEVTKGTDAVVTAPTGYYWDNNVLTMYAVKVGESYYATLAEAFAAVQDGQTITVLKDCAGDGIKVAEGRNFTVDFNGKTYTIDGETVGSSGTQTNGFQLLKNSTLTFKNGTITSTKAKILIQNYSNLTLDKMILDGASLQGDHPYTLSTNNGASTIKDTKIIAHEDGVAFDVCSFGSYTSNTVSVEGSSEIVGPVELSRTNAAPLALNLNGGNFTAATIVVAAGGETAVVKKDETVEITAPAGYMWNNNQLIAAVAKIGDNSYATLSEAFAAVQDGEIITVLKDCAGDGIKVAEGRNFTVDFNGKTYTIDGETVGSAGTQTNGFQLLKNSTLTFKNGTITSTKAKILIQNYSNLTLDKMILDGASLQGAHPYTLSTNNGASTIKDTKIVAHENGVAFDVCSFGSYTSNTVSVEGDSKIVGPVELSRTNAAPLALNLNGGDFSEASIIVADGGEDAVVKKDAEVTLNAPEDYEWNSENILVPTACEMTVYVGNATGHTVSTLVEWKNIQKEHPNAMALVSSEYEQYVAGLTNVIVDYTVGHNNHYYECENFELTDGYDWYSPVKEFTAVKGSYSRTIYDGLNAICVPFEIGEGVPFTKHVFHSSNEAGTTAYFNSITNVNAGKAFIAQVSGTSSWIFNFDNTPIFDNPMEGGAFRGTYRDSNVSNCYKINDAGTGLQYHSTAMNYAFRGYFVLENENLFGGQPNNLRIAFDEIEDDTTGISAIGNGTNVDVIYNVQGLRLSKQQKGINILNGKKVLK